MSFHAGPYLEYAYSLLDERNPNPARYICGRCRECGDACDCDADLCYHCQQQEIAHEAPQAQTV